MGTETGTRVQLCGRYLVRLEGTRVEERFPGRQGRVVFAYLATRPYFAADRAELMEAIWPETLPSAPEMALSALLSKLRRILGEPAIEGRSEIRLNLPIGSWIDVLCARESIHRAESLIGARHWWEAYGPAVTSRYISERPFMRGEPGSWADAIRTELADIHIRALECDARIGIAVGGHELQPAINTARRLIDLSPFRESGYVLLMQALAKEGNSAEALRVYEALRQRLRNELGTSPAAEAQEAHRRVLAGS